MMISQRNILTRLAAGEPIAAVAGADRSLETSTVQDLRWLEAAGFIDKLKLTDTKDASGQRSIGATASVTKKGKLALADTEE